MSGVTLDWSSAEVRDGELEVAVRGKLPKGWKGAFDRTVALLHGGEWGKVSLKKDHVRVQHVAEVREDRLRHFLESVIQQANASVGLEDEDDDDGSADDESTSVDAEMTQRFRSFDAKSGKQER